MDFRLHDYLERIGVSYPVKPDLATLAAMHVGHVNAIPFEAIDPLLGRPVPLDLTSLQAKLIDSQRGGYCFEQNTLFKAALKAVGFEVTGLAGRVRWMSPPDAPLGPRDHMLLRVDLPEGPYLADVGFGACLLDTPLRLDVGAEQTTAMGTFRLTEADGLLWVSAKRPEGWRVMYAFNQEPQIEADYVLANWFTSTNPATPFPNVLIMERLSADSRYKLINCSFSIEARDGEVVAKREIARAEELGDVLTETFKVVPPTGINAMFEKIAG